MLVYRLESKDDKHIGGYSIEVSVQYSSVGALLSKFRSGGTHPGPLSDKLLHGKWTSIDSIQRTELYFGFGDAKSFLTWFDQHHLYDNMNEYARVGVYEVPISEVILGERQVVFPLEKYEPIKTFSLIEFLEQYKDEA